MNKINTFIIDSSSVDRDLSLLADRELRRNIIFDGLKAGTQLVKKKTIANMQSVPNSTNFKKGVRVKTDKAYLQTMIMILYTARFFETGTKDRYTKSHKVTGEYYRGKRKYLTRGGKGHWVGKIATGYYFFQKAREDENSITQAITQSIDKALKNLGIT